MRVGSDGTVTYFYSTGIRLPRRLRLGAVELIPCEAVRIPVMDLQDQVANEHDFGIVCLFINSTTFQMRVSAHTGEELAVTSWNAQWLYNIVTALSGHVTASNLQCDTPIEDLPNKQRLRVTNYYTFGLRSSWNDSAILSGEDADWLEGHYDRLSSLLDAGDLLPALHALASYSYSPLGAVQLATLWAGIESLFDVEHEITHQVSLFCANYLGRTHEERAELYRSVRELYKQRSKAVHGARAKKGKKNKDSQRAAAVDQSADLLRRLVRQCVIDGRVPDRNRLVFPSG